MNIQFADLEGDGLLDTVSKVWCGVFKQKGTGQIVKFRPTEVKAMLSFLDTVDVLVMHNGIGYDLPVLEKLYGYKFKGKIVDTLIMSRLLNPKRILPPNCVNRRAGPHSIEAWGWRVGRGKPEHNDWGRFSEEMLHRCSEDVEILELVYDALMLEAEGFKWKDAFKLSFELFSYLQKQEQYGWHVDTNHMHTCIRILNKWVERIDRVLTPKLPLVLEIEENKVKGEVGWVKKPFLKSGKYSEITNRWYSNSGCTADIFPVCGPFSRINFRVVNLDSNVETKDYLLNLGWEPLEWNINDDGERTSPKLSKDDPFEGISGKLGNLVAKRVQCRHRRSTIEGLLEIVRDDGSIAARVSNLAVTGRAIHSGIVNIPKATSFFGKQMRKCFSSRKGMVIVGTDSEGNQLRMLAGRMNSPTFISALIEGKKELGTDNHSLTQKIGDLESRDIAKNVMYALLFGAGDTKLAKTAKKPPGSGAELRGKLYRGLDGLGELMERLTKEWRSSARQRYNSKFGKMEYYDGIITGLDSRPIRVPYEHQILVYLLQSDEAIMMTKAYCLACAELDKKYKFGVDWGVVCFYHDEYTFECREEIAQDVLAISEKAIRDAGKFFKISCPHEGKGAIGKNWYDIH